MINLNLNKTNTSYKDSELKKNKLIAKYKYKDSKKQFCLQNEFVKVDTLFLHTTKLIFFMNIRNQVKRLK